MPGFAQAFAQGLTEVSTTEKVPLGTVRDEGTKRYRYCKLRNVTATVAGAAGDPVAYAVAATSADEGVCTVVLDLTDAAAVPIFAGVLLATVAGVLATDYFVWVQFSGPVTSLPAIAGTIGQGFKLGAADKTWAAIAAFTDNPVGVVFNVASKVVVLNGNL